MSDQLPLIPILADGIAGRCNAGLTRTERTATVLSRQRAGPLPPGRGSPERTAAAGCRAMSGPWGDLGTVVRWNGNTWGAVNSGTHEEPRSGSDIKPSPTAPVAPRPLHRHRQSRVGSATASI